MKNSLSFFFHYPNETNNADMLILRDKYGFEGIGRYYRIKEILSVQDGCEYALKSDNNLMKLALELDMKSLELLEFIEYISANCPTLMINNNGVINIPSLTETLRKVNIDRQNARNRKKKNNEGSPRNAKSSPRKGKSSGGKAKSSGGNVESSPRNAKSSQKNITDIYIYTSSSSNNNNNNNNNNKGVDNVDNFEKVEKNDKNKHFYGGTDVDNFVDNYVDNFSDNYDLISSGGNAKSSPRNAESSGGKAKSSGGNVESSPRNAESSPENMENNSIVDEDYKDAKLLFIKIWQTSANPIQLKELDSIIKQYGKDATETAMRITCKNKINRRDWNLPYVRGILRNEENKKLSIKIENEAKAQKTNEKREKPATAQELREIFTKIFPNLGKYEDKSSIKVAKDVDKNSENYKKVKAEFDAELNNKEK